MLILEQNINKKTRTDNIDSRFILINLLECEAPKSV